MKGAIAVFVKTPELTPVKTRLANMIGERDAISFFVHSVAAIKDVLLEIRSTNDITPFWAVGEKKGLDNDLWTDFDTIHTGNGTLGERLHNIYSKLLKDNDYAILLGADSPQISPEIISAAIKKINEGKDYVIGPAEDGGFYLFAGKKEVAKKVWTSIEYSADDTLINLLEKLEGEDIDQITKLIDVDDLESLNRLYYQFRSNCFLSQRQLKEWIRTHTWQRRKLSA